MSQIQQTRRELQQDTVAPEVPAARLAEPPAQVRVIAGADVQDMDIVGRTVAEARAVARAIFGIEARARALLDGRGVEEEHCLAAGQVLEFVRHAGRKGAAAGAPALPGESAPASTSIEVAGDTVTWRRNGRTLATTTVGDLLARVAERGPAPQRWHLHPHQVRLMVERGRAMGVVVEMPPGPRQVRWIADDAGDPLGMDGRYETLRLSFPWVVLLLVFAEGELSGATQAFYRRAPLGSLADELCYTNLLNVARGYNQESWVCLVNLVHRLDRLSWEERIQAVTDHFWRAAFTRSSEVHEGNSFWGTMRGIDRRLKSPATWEAATRENPYFALDVAWRRAPEPLGRTLERMLDMVMPWSPIERVEQLATVMQGAEE